MYMKCCVSVSTAPTDSLAGRKATVTFDYDAQNEDELTLKCNEVVEVIQEVEEGWWEGTFNGKKGLFPSNFVTLIEEDEKEKPKLPVDMPQEGKLKKYVLPSS